MNAQAKNLQTLYAKTRLLLALWDLGGSQQKVARGKLNDKMKLKNKNIPGYPEILQELEQEGYGKVRPKRLYKDDKGYYNKNSNSGVKQYLKTGSNRSGRDLYIINMNNPKAVPKPRVKKGEGEYGR